MKRKITVEVDEELYSLFKCYCVLGKTSVQAGINELIKIYCDACAYIPGVTNIPTNPYEEVKRKLTKDDSEGFIEGNKCFDINGNEIPKEYVNSKK